MSMFDLKSPDAYPLYIHRAVDYLDKELTKGIGVRSTMMGPIWATEADAKREYRRFHAYKANVKRHPLHRHAEVLERVEFRCVIRQEGTGFRLHLTARGKCLAGLKAALGL